ncbi:MAG: ATP-binding protein [Oligoflexia bacterium]|nr:ATP-binding protein [Oligoflexia bacterium]
MRTAKSTQAKRAAANVRLVTERRSSKDRRASRVTDPESKYRVLFEQASDAILTLNTDGTFDDANEAFQELTGFVKSELVGATIDLLQPGAPSAGSPERRQRALSHEMLATPGTYEDVCIARKDGYIRYVELSVRTAPSLTIALFRDVTEKKRMERELITKHAELRDAYFRLERKTAEFQAMQETLVQSGKMAALGELAAGIAHELNQPLLGIRGYAQELQALALPALKGCPTEAESAAALKEVISNVDKMSAIIGHLRTFVRKSTENFEFSQVHQAIEEALKMLDRQFASRGIAVEKNFARELPQVYANPLQLEQVFINLATNARDAIEATGRGRGKISITTADAGPVVEIRFRDDGCGMDMRTKSKAFNPFFTTKEVGKGMGLGLSLSYGILSKIHGSIVVESELGKGAEFVIRIPKDFRELG